MLDPPCEGVVDSVLACMIMTPHAKQAQDSMSRRPCQANIVKQVTAEQGRRNWPKGKPGRDRLVKS